MGLKEWMQLIATIILCLGGGIVLLFIGMLKYFKNFLLSGWCATSPEDDLINQRNARKGINP